MSSTQASANPGKPYVIVVGVDRSEMSELAIQEALSLAAAKPYAEMHLVNVVPAYGPQATYTLSNDTSDSELISVDEAQRRFGAYADQALRRFTERHAGKHLGRVITHLRFDAIADQIAQLAADLEADLIVVGTHGRRGLSRLLLGSSAEATVRLAPCPVMVVRPKALPEPAPRIEPPCPRCIEARRVSAGVELWCEQHRERHGQRHTYHQGDRIGADAGMPLVLRQ